jgi:DNA polymerase/3'-5' exonuclease PolX
MADFYDKIAYNLKTLYEHHKYITKNTWKSKAYHMTLDKLRNYRVLNPDFRIQSMDDISGIGVGKGGILDKISWIIENGRDLPDVCEVVASGDLDSIHNLATIHNIGASKAVELVTVHNIRTIDDLKQNLQLLNNLQRKGVHFHDDIIQRIPRDEMHEHNHFVLDSMRRLEETLGGEINCIITGSYRRGEATSGDIDVLVCPHNPTLEPDLCKFIVENFQMEGYVQKNGVFALGKKKFMGMCKLPGKKVHRRLDIILTTPDELPFMLLYFTGNGDFNVKMRELAKQKGYLLNECGLFKVDTEHVENATKKEGKKETVVKCKVEKDIFDFLGISFVEPNERRPDALILNS